MGRSVQSLGRGAPRYKPQATVLVLCEDVKSGKRYIEDATYHFRIHVSVEVAHCGKTDPKGIIMEAIARQRDFDFVYCAIDRDTHHNFDEALNIAKAHKKIIVIASYPCFEFWYLLHFRFLRTPYVAAGNKSAGDCLIADLRRCDGLEGYAKGADENIFRRLLPKLPDAMRNSPRVLERAAEEGNSNPSTKVHELIEFFGKLSTPQPK